MLLEVFQVFLSVPILNFINSNYKSMYNIFFVKKILKVYLNDSIRDFKVYFNKILSKKKSSNKIFYMFKINFWRKNLGTNYALFFMVGHG